jgi:hypothetical protein
VAADLPGGRQPVEDRHLDVDESDVGSAGERGLDGRAAVAGLRCHDDAG